MDVLLKYFSDLTQTQQQQFELLGPLYTDWNAKINVISRKDIENLYEHHVLHSLAITKLIRFKEGTNIIDVGTGGGLPGIPLAIMCPDVEFCLVDSVKKKIMVAQDVARAIGLKNCTFINDRVENIHGKYYFIVSRAAMPMGDLIKFTRNLCKREGHNGMPNGYICLKGGDLREELSPYKNKAEITALSSFFEEEYFRTKKIVYIPY